MYVNVEKLHSRWMTDMTSLAWKFGQGRFPKTRSEGSIVYMPSEEDMEIFGPSLAPKGRFPLPSGSGAHILEMARFATCTFFEIDGIRDLEEKIIPLPPTLFCLNSVLLAAFPKYLGSDMFKPTDAADYEPEDPEYVRFHSFNAFAGLGFILMNETRKILSPMSPDKEVTEMSEGLFLCVLDKVDQ